MLKFIGTGSCFNYKMGNNSAYYIHNVNGKKRFILFDCGEDVFHKILNNNLLNEIDEVFVVITHLHSDHVGSLPSFVFYLHFVLNIKPVIYFPCDDINIFFKLVGIKKELYLHTKDSKGYYDITPFKHNHGYELNSFGYVLNLDGNLIYYSGDTKTIDEKVLDIFRGKDDKYVNTPIKYFYQDVTKYVNDAHMNIHNLAKIFSKEERKRVTLMHFDDEEVIKIAEEYGFNIAEKK